MIRSCGMEGFKNTRKGTNIAAQATAISLSTVSSLCYFTKVENKKLNDINLTSSIITTNKTTVYSNVFSKLLKLATFIN